MFGFLGARQRGAAALEFVVVLPLLLLLVFGMVDVGRLYWARMGAVAGANEAVRMVAIKPTLTTAEVTAIANAAMAPWTAQSVTPTPCDATSASTASASVTVVLNVRFVTPLAAILRLFGGTSTATSMTISSTGIYRCLV